MSAPQTRRRFIARGLAGLAGLGLLGLPRFASAWTCQATSPNTRGPYWREGAPATTRFACTEGGTPLFVRGRVVDTSTCRAVSGATLDVWHADHYGKYDIDYPDLDLDTYLMRGTLRTGDDGTYAFRSIVPKPFGTEGFMRPAHVHFAVRAEGFQPLTTQMYFAEDPYLDSDPIESVRDDLVVTLAEHENGAALGDASLAGPCFSAVFDIGLRTGVVGS